MKDTDQNKYQLVLSTLQHFHSVAGIAFPMAVTKIGKTTTQTFAADQEGSRIFIPTNVFSECEKIALSVQEVVEKLDSSDLKNQVQSCWTELSDVLRRIKKAGRQGNIGAINEAFILLCLASGILQHYISSKTEIALPHTPQFWKVEPLEKLLDLCGRSELKTLTVEKILLKVTEEIRMCLP